jgi:hypothetical protein
MWLLRSAAAAVMLLPVTVAAQQQQPQHSSEWSKLPRMQLERQFAGPLQDTIIQRWRDPVDGTVCYIYLPITAAHTPPTSTGFVQYGPNTIGAISCIEPQHAAAPPANHARQQQHSGGPNPPKPPAAPAAPAPR